MSAHATLATLAKKTADTRRALMALFGTDLGVRSALDLMGLPNPTPEQLRYAQIIANEHRTTLAASQLYLADADMVALLDASAPAMPDQELHETDIITPHGFIYFAEPLPDRSGVEPLVPIRALSWAFLPETSPLLTERNPGASVLITSYVTAADAMAAHGITGPDVEIAPNTPKHLPNATVVWTIGTLIGEAFGQTPPEGGYTPGFYQRALAAFWTLAQQPKMTTTSDMEPGRPTDQRRNRRAGVINAAAPVRLVRLHQRFSDVSREQQTEGERGSGGRMTVRSITRGHWRNQWYSSVQQHRHIWVDAFWRGPEDAPVVGGERVFLAQGPTIARPEQPTR